ncbi:cohesin domain-containing protein [Halovivax cerinus]|uniref:Cohesin domain-containing protein n=1 Tax=Halovivax cerinus TaxID=1487865 RepID=A0ABD5NQ84_9EURY|nr:cohesin domain-containing protein [Halovivax cerinus]
MLLLGSVLVPAGGAVVGTTEPTDEPGGLTTADTARSNVTLSLVVDESTDESVTVTLETDASDVAGYGANVTFDPAVVTVDTVSGVDMSDPTTNVDNERGWVFVTQSQANGIDEPVLAEFTFAVEATGETTLSFEDDTTVNDGGTPPEELPVDLDGTTIAVEDDGSGGVGSGGTGSGGSGGDGPSGSGGDESDDADGGGTDDTDGADTGEDGGGASDGTDDAGGTDGDGDTDETDDADSDGDSDGTDAIDSLPGFGIVPALVAVCAALAAGTERN